MTKDAERLRRIAATLIAMADELDARAFVPPAPAVLERRQLIADIRAKLPVVAIGHLELAAAIADAMDRVENSP